MLEQLAQRYPSSTMSIVTATGLVPAAAYIRVSSGKHLDGFSPEIQREAISAYARQEGHDLVLVESDTKSGHVVSREGYQRVLDAAHHHEQSTARRALRAGLERR